METTTTHDPDIRKTPDGWMVVAHDDPRIAVMGSTPAEAMDEFERRLETWRELMSESPVTSE